MGYPENADDVSEIGWLFGIAARLLSGAVFRVIDEHQLSPTGLGVLMILSVENGLKSTEVAARIACTPATLTTVASTLERNGHLRRRTAISDRRVVELHLTEHGRRHADLVRRRLDDWYRETFAFLGDDERRIIRPFLATTIEHLTTTSLEGR